MLKRILLILSLVPAALFSQSSINEAVLYNGEAHVSILKSEIKDLEKLENVLYIDEHFSDEETFQAIVTLPQLQDFIDLGVNYTVLDHPNKAVEIEMIDLKTYNQAKSTDCGTFLTGYPSYDLYEQMMFDFAIDYPEICRYEEIETLPSGRKLLAVVISDNPDEVEDEPRFLYTSSIHGDETAGYMLMMRMIQDILCNYSSDAQVANLVDNVEIWINPLANPDGTYALGNNTLNGARRTNSNFVDLNRNYLDPDDGANPDGNPYQDETIAFMELAEDVHFDMSSNMHGGVEVANYPWDTWSFLHADDDWWVHVCRQYADTAQENSPSGYFNFLDNGITNGYAWYSVAGGRQDFMTYFHHGRELTLELSDQKLLSTSQFDNFWNYNRSALYNYMEQSLFGLRGIVTDANTGEPIVANAYIFNHDMENSDVYSRLPNGNYHRYLHEGSYDVTFSADGYQSQTITVSIENDESTLLNVALMPDNVCDVVAGSISTFSALSNLCAGDNSPDLIEVDVQGNVGFAGVFGIVDQANNVMGSSQSGNFNVNNLSSGTYRIKHMTYAQGVNPSVSNASELEGCYALSNSIFFSVNRVEGGVISTNESTQVCGDDGQPSTINFVLVGAEGANSKWAVLNSGFTEVISSANSPEFNFDNFGSGVYRVVHVSYSNGVNLGEVDPQNIQGCLDVSNTLTITVQNCASNLTQYTSGPNASILFTPEVHGDYQVQLLDLNGRVLMDLYSGVSEANRELRLDLNTTRLAAGIYLIRAIGGESSEMKKIMIE
ncbi:M14 family zinc carboxypeptidase [Cryomorphaceae bacterium 1068]|nr:M14 family zinc carboxypeptidase [Cryomorphaceae bacterium 1068]